MKQPKNGSPRKGQAAEAKQEVIKENLKQVIFRVDDFTKQQFFHIARIQGKKVQEILSEYVYEYVRDNTSEILASMEKASRASKMKDEIKQAKKSN